jgi:hypothetical protein
MTSPSFPIFIMTPSARLHREARTLRAATFLFSPKINAMKNPMSQRKKPRNFCLVSSDSSCDG